MTLPVVVTLLAAAALGVFGQDAAPLKAGDRAPNLTWTKIVASSLASAGPHSLSGQTTVLLFLRPVSQNEQALSIWNKLVEKFADKPVNFIWIATEGADSLTPFLKRHPVGGWMALDPEAESYKTYGIGGAAGVLIDAHGTVAGFTFMTPQEDQIQAVLDGRAIAIKGDPTGAQMDAIFQGKAVRLETEPSQPMPPPQKPDLSPSEEVHIYPSQANGTIESIGPDYWMKRGFDLRAILSKVLGTNPSRIDLPAALDNGNRYDFVLVPPQEEDEETMNRQVREGIEKYFRITIQPAIRSKEVYVLTTVEGKTPPRKSEAEAAGGGSMSFSTGWFSIAVPQGTTPTREALEEASRQASAVAQLTAMTAHNTSVDGFCRALEDGLQRPVVDESKLSGVYDFKVRGEARTTEEFLGMLRDQLGLVLTPTSRSIEMLVVRSLP